MLAFAPDESGAAVAPVSGSGSAQPAQRSGGSSHGSAGPSGAAGPRASQARTAGPVAVAPGPTVAATGGLAAGRGAVLPKAVGSPAAAVGSDRVRTLRAESPTAAVVEVPRVPEAPLPERRAGEPADAAVAASESAQWFELVTNLGLSGVARMIAEHSELVARDEGVYRLRLDHAHDTLLADAPVAALERALSAHTGDAVKVRVEVGPVAGETPAARLARERLERQQAAEALLQSDRTVQQLLSEFDGHIEGVTPVD